MFEQIKLDYQLDALEPHFDTLTMETHYGKHHAAYTKNFNELAAKIPALSDRSAEEILSNLMAVPEEYRTGIQNNGGGYLNHNIFFERLSPNGGGEPTGCIAESISRDFGSFSNMVELMSKAAMAQFGSGWAWLISDPDGKLTITSTPNQNSPINEGKLGILLGLDVWEHAYYLKYKNLRADYITAFFNVVDWNKVEAVYDGIKSNKK